MMKQSKVKQMLFIYSQAYQMDYWQGHSWGGQQGQKPQGVELLGHHNWGLKATIRMGRSRESEEGAPKLTSSPLSNKGKRTGVETPSYISDYWLIPGLIYLVTDVPCQNYNNYIRISIWIGSHYPTVSPFLSRGMETVLKESMKYSYKLTGNITLNITYF